MNEKSFSTTREAEDQDDKFEEIWKLRLELMRGYEAEILRQRICAQIAPLPAAKLDAGPSTDPGESRDAQESAESCLSQPQEWRTPE